VAQNGADPVPDAVAQRPWPGRPDALQVGYFGSLYKGRGVELIPKLARRMPQVDFHVVGGEEHEVDRWTARCRFPNVFFHGFIRQNRIHRYRNACDVLLAGYQRRVMMYGEPTSDSSAYMSPVKIFEYMASGKAIVASDLPAVREVLTDDSAMLVAPDDVDAWQNAIERFDDPVRRRTFGEAARRRFQNRFTWRIRAQRVLNNLTPARGREPSRTRQY
jgi:glycosyltransferase involved in cell wall biosynthesis